LGLHSASKSWQTTAWANRANTSVDVRFPSFFPIAESAVCLIGCLLSDRVEDQEDFHASYFAIRRESSNTATEAEDRCRHSLCALLSSACSGE
jgi:hypothetical protein